MFHGSMVALVTPMTPKGDAVDRESLHKLIEFHIEQGTQAIVVVGTTGEGATLTALEKQHLIRQVVEQVKERVPVIAGSYAESTAHTIELTRMVMEEGVDAALIMTPAYIKPTQEGLYLHYKAIAEAVALPQILYNVPSRTACDLLPETIGRLAGISNIIGIKEATGQLNRFIEIKKHCESMSFDVYSGDDATAKDLMLLGAKGVISVTANIAPRMMAEMCRYAIAQDASLAHELNDRLEPLHKGLFVESNPIPVKWALHRLGWISAGIRLPLTPLSPGNQEGLLQAMKSVGLL